jgi:hypothetical protein
MDRSIPKAVAEALKLVRGDILWLEDCLAHDVKDPEWLREVGKAGWLVILRDKKVRTRPAERRAILENDVGAFILNQGSDPTKWRYLQLLTQTLDEMEQKFATTRRPFIYTVSRDGRINQVL